MKIFLRKNTKGIVVWDFDGVLFRTPRFKKDIERILHECGVRPSLLKMAERRLRRGHIPFSLSSFLKILRISGAAVNVKKFRHDVHQQIISNKYFDPAADGVLRHLKRRGFVNVILSWGSTSFQLKKIHTGCREGFLRHFAAVRITQREKLLTLKKFARRNAAHPIFFVDDTPKNIALVKKHVPSIIALYYNRGRSLKDIEREIFSV